jgi:tape measure domain-containing protein
MATISTNDIKIRYDIDLTKLQQATSQFDKITAEERALLSELGKLKKQFDDVGDKAKKAGKESSESFGNVNNTLKSLASTLATVFTVTQIVNFTKAVVQTAIEFESLRKAINFTSGSIEAGAGNMQFLREVSNRLGISLESAASGYKAISASATQAGYSNIQTQKIFENVSKAVAAFGLSSEDAAGVFRALSQIISKGIVSSEELRQQIGDRLPGAFNIASKAIGKNEIEFNKLLATGKITAAEFVVPFTEALGKMSDEASKLDSMGKGLQRFSNAWSKMMETLGRQIDEGVGIGRFVNALTRTLDYLAESTQTAMQAQEKAIGEGYQSIMESEIVDYDKSRKEKVKIAIDSQIEITKTELNAANERLKLQEKELQETSPFRLYRRQEIRATIRDTKDEIEAIGLKIDTYKGESKALEELINQKEKLKQAQIDPKFEQEQYQRKLKLLQLERELAQLNIKINFDNKIDILREEYVAEKKFLNDAYNLQVEYSAKGVQAATDAIKVTDKERTLNRVETVRDLKEVTQTTLEEINKQRIANSKFEQDKTKAQDERISKKEKTDFELEQLDLKHQEKMDELDKQFAEERKRRAKEEEDEKQALREKAFELTQTLANGAFDLYQSRLSNELTLLDKRYNEEIRLADGNQQKIDELNQQKEIKEKELKTRQFKAEQAAAASRVLFQLAQEVMKYGVSNPPLAILAGFIAAAQLGIIASQPVPEFAEGTKGKPFKGGKAMVGERGVEKVVTESGKVYFTPPTATLVDLPKGSQVIPNHALSKQEIYWGSMQSGRQASSGSPVVGEIRELGSILKGLPITQLNMDERGFEKFIRTPRRTTKILNNRFRTEN